jgi:hypothetical protein
MIVLFHKTSMKTSKGRLFVCFLCHIKISQTMVHLATLGVVVQPSMSRGGSSWFHIVSECSGEVMNY